MKQLQTKEFYEFLDFRLDAENRLLWRAEQIIPLTVKEFEVLLMLVERARQVVGKDELLDKIWKDTYVEEGTLTRNISYLRKKLGAGEGTPQYIETLPKRGYRFTPEVSKKVESAAPENIVEPERITAENKYVVEEQTLTRIRVEEQISVSPKDETSFNGGRNFDFNPASAPKLLPAAKTKRPFRLFSIALIFLVALAAGFAVYRNFNRQAAPSVILTSRVAPFTGFPGREDMPSFSPDGKQLVFVWNGGDRKTMDVYVKMIGEGEPVRLTDKNHDTVYPAFSPDGKRIAFFLSFPDRSEIYMISALGGAERKIAEVRSGGTSFAWSSDGKSIAVADQISDDTAKPETGIHTIDVETGKKNNLTVPPENFRDHSPRFAPDGKSLAFIRSDANHKADLFVKSLTDETAPRRLTFSEAYIFSLAWGADGKTIIFNSKRDSSTQHIRRVSAAGGEPEVIVTNAKAPTNLAVSPDGKTIALVESFNQYSVQRFDINAETGKILTSKFVPYVRRDQNPQLSPDGALLAFSLDRSGTNEIWLADAEGKNQRQLTDANGLAGSPRFSPDGKSVVYDVKINGKGEIYISSVEGGEPRRITDNPAHDVIPSWSADGNWIYFCSDRSGEYQIWKAPARGGEAMQITKQGGVESIPAPDGKTVFYLKENGSGGLWQTSVDGSEERLIPELVEVRHWRSWSVTKKGIYFIAASESSPYRIKFYDFLSQQITELKTIEKKPISSFPALSASSDGTIVIFSEQDQNASSILIAELSK